MVAIRLLTSGSVATGRGDGFIETLRLCCDIEPSGTVSLNVLLGDSFTLNSTFGTVQMSVCESTWHANHVVDHLLAPSVLFHEPFTVAIPEHSLKCAQETVCTVVSRSEPCAKFVS